jgi:hypothetical protein
MSDDTRPITRPSRSSGDVKEIVNPLGRHADAGRKGGWGAEAVGERRPRGASLLRGPRVPMTRDSCSICATHPHSLAVGQTACAAAY